MRQAHSSQVITQLLSGSGNETGRDDFVQPSVLRGVYVEQNQLAPADLLVVHAFLVAGQGGLFQVGEGAAVTVKRPCAWTPRQ